MIVAEGETAEALYHLLKPVGPAPDHHAVVYRGDKRYAGFRDADHAAFFVRRMGWAADATIRIEAISPCPS